MATTSARQGRIRKALQEMRHHGGLRTLHDLAIKALNTIVVAKILRGVAVERPDAGFLACPVGYSPMFLTDDAVRAFAKNPEYELSERFVEEALSRGDRCFAICDGTVLAAYGWYSSAPTRIDPPDLQLRFSDKYVYMYKGFTHPRHRGKRLHAMGMTIALQHFLSMGFRGLVSYVESNNFDSLKSVFRMGYFHFGSVYVVKVAGRCLSHSSRGCDRFGFRVEPANIAPAGARVRLAI
jgi:hypothetical protein